MHLKCQIVLLQENRPNIFMTLSIKCTENVPHSNANALESRTSWFMAIRQQAYWLFFLYIFLNVMSLSILKSSLYVDTGKKLHSLGDFIGPPESEPGLPSVSP